MLGVDVALLGDHIPGAVGALIEPGYRREAIDLGTGFARGHRVGVGDAVGIDMAAVRTPQRTDELVRIDEGVELLRFGRRDELGFETEIFRPRMHQTQVIHDLFVGCEHHVAGGMDTARLAGDFLDLAIEIDRVFLQLRDVGIGIVGVHAGSCMPRRARRQFVLFDQYDIAPAGLGQVIKHTGTDDAAANHNGTSMSFHEGEAFSFTSCRGMRWCQDGLRTRKWSRPSNSTNFIMADHT